MNPPGIDRSQLNAAILNVQNKLKQQQFQTDKLKSQDLPDLEKSETEIKSLIKEFSDNDAVQKALKEAGDKNRVSSSFVRVNGTLNHLRTVSGWVQELVAEKKGQRPESTGTGNAMQPEATPLPDYLLKEESLSRLDRLDRKINIWLRLTSRDVIASTIGGLSILIVIIGLLGIMGCTKDATAHEQTRDILGHSLMVILGYFFGQSTLSQATKKDDADAPS